MGCIEEEKDLFVRIPIWVATNALSILESHNPEAPTKYQDRNCVTYECPECEREVRHRQRYCSYCGKRLDWNEL